MKVTTEGADAVIENDNGERWSIQPGQVEAHLRGIESKRHPFNALSKGDKSAMRDIAAQWSADVANGNEPPPPK